MAQEAEQVQLQMQVRTRLKKIREGETEPYEVIEEYFDENGVGITDTVRSEVLAENEE